MDPLPVSEYADALPMLEAAMADLAKGQLVRDERYAMMDLMSAIEVNDARTDTFLHAQSERDAHPALPPFDPALTTTPEAILWVHDEVLRLEATFHAGHPLSATLWTCNYLRPASLAVLCGLAPSISAALENSQTELQRTVLRALLLGVLKCSELVWEELSKNQVYEHEDVHLSLGSLSFNTLMASCFPPASPIAGPTSPLLVQDQEPPAQQPAERTVSVDEVLRALDDALRWLHAEDQVEASWLNAETRKALVTRVTLRIDLLYPFALFPFPAHTSPSVISQHLSRIKSYTSHFPSAAAPLVKDASAAFVPPPALRAAFLPSTTVPLLATQQPPRPVTPLMLGEAYDFIRTLVGDIEDLMRLWERWHRGEGTWVDLHEWSRARGRTQAVPYVRSLQQSLIVTPSHLFHTYPLTTLATSFLTTLTPVPSSLFTTLPLLLARESHPSAPAHSLTAFLARLAAKLAQFAPALAGQNRPRQRRWVVKSLSTWADLVRETRVDAQPLVLDVLRAVAPALPEGDAQRVARGAQRLSEAVAAHAQELALEALLCGFEDAVGLFDGEEDRREAWWVGARLAGRLERLWEGLLQGKGEGEEGRTYLEMKRIEARAVEAVCMACWLAIETDTPRLPAKFSSPFLPSLAISPAVAERGRFRQRFEWLDNLPTASGAAEEAVADWESYCAERDEAVRDETTAAAACERAVAALSALEQLPPLAHATVPSSSAARQRLGPLSKTPSSAFCLPDSAPYQQLSALLRQLGDQAG